MAESKIARANYLKRTTVSGTTDANGNLRLTAPDMAKIVLFVWDGNKIFIPFYYNGSWYARVQSTNAQGTAVTNTAITGEMFYI